MTKPDLEIEVQHAIEELQHGQVQAALDRLQAALRWDTRQAAMALGIASWFKVPELAASGDGSHFLIKH